MVDIFRMPNYSFPVFRVTGNRKKETTVMTKDRSSKVLRGCVSLVISCVFVVNLIKVVQVLNYGQKRRKTVRERNSGPRLNAAFNRDSVREIGADCPDDKRATLVEFAKQRPAADPMNGNTIDGVLLKVGERVADRPGEKARSQDVLRDDTRIPKPAHLGPYRDFRAKIPQGETVGGKIQS
jgi:hypothetical protein